MGEHKDRGLKFKTSGYSCCCIDSPRRASGMSADRRTLAQLRAQARQARNCGHFSASARLERQAVDLAGALNLAGERTQALLWEGYSLRQAGEDDLALAALLQVAGERAATANPADIFSALTAILYISLECKPARFCRALLEQGRGYLVEIHQSWAAPLDFLEGELAYRQGDFMAAWDWHCRAWAGWRDEHPRLTAATHLWALCRVAFRRRDPAELVRFTEKLVERRPVQALERQLVQRAQLLSWRARRVADTSCATAEAALIEVALALLAETADHANRDGGGFYEAVRALALMGYKTTTLDTALSQYRLDSEGFDHLLLMGDLGLNQVRAALGQSAVDDDYGEDMTDVSAPSPAVVTTAVSVTENCYQTALLLATAEDERLETGWYRRTVHERQSRFEAVAHCSFSCAPTGSS